MCCPSLAKVLLIIFNIIFFVIGVVLLAIGIWTITDPYKTDVLAILDNPVIANVAILLIVLGVFIVIVSFLGCCGAIKKQKCMLIVYFVIVLLIFLIQFIACCVAVAYKDKVDEFVTDNLQDTMDDFKVPWNNADEKYNLAWNGMQFLLECCGTYNYTDWSATEYAEQNDAYKGDVWTYPPSCCRVDDPTDIPDGETYPMPNDLAGCANGDMEAMNTDGCYDAFENWVIDNALYVGGTGLGLAFLEIFCMVFAMCIYCDARKDGETA